ncbi:MAG: CHRD domain-containing protein [Saprospiraceae bacterium]|nr:CHRD domain-containing protein [Saprospiraceae bacterium]
MKRKTTFFKNNLAFVFTVLLFGVSPLLYAQTYTATLSGAAEAPPNSSAGVGSVTVIINTTLNTMRVQVSFSGLTGNTTAAHIHASTVAAGTGTAGVATTTPSFVGFPSGVTSGSMDNTFDMTLASSYNASYITANGGTTSLAFDALKAGIAGGQAYFNIHTSFLGGGEIRGFLGTVVSTELTQFNGSTEGGKNSFTWTTTNETKSYAFDIERGTDGKSFTKIAQVKAQGKPTTYTFVDDKPLNGANYYRLKLMDNDQNFNFSKVVSLQNSKSKTAVKVYPTSTNGFVTVEAIGSSIESVSVFEPMGRLVLATQKTNRVDMSALPSGMYLVQVQAGGEKVVEKVFKY